MEEVHFQGRIESKASGEALATKGFDFKESWPLVTRHLHILPAITTPVAIDTGEISTIKIIGIEVENPAHIRLNAQGANDQVLLRKSLVAMVSSATLSLGNETSTLNHVKIFMAGE